MKTRNPELDELRGVVGPAIESLGLVLDQLTLVTAGARRTLRVVIDLGDDAPAGAGVDLEYIAQASHTVSAALDEDSPFGDRPFTLEVTSPGVSRPLTEHRHWRRARGRLVRVSVAGEPRRTVRVLDTDEAGVTVDDDGTRRSLPWADLGEGHVVIEFSRRDASGAQSTED